MKEDLEHKLILTQRQPSKILSSLNKEIKKFSSKLKIWKQVQDWILNYLETGNKLFNEENPETYIQTKRVKSYIGIKFPNFREIIEMDIQQQYLY